MNREKQIQRLSCQESFNPVMIFDALQQIAQKFGVEKTHGQLHQLDKEVGY